jgi:hypothetical protein
MAQVTAWMNAQPYVYAYFAFGVYRLQSCKLEPWHTMLTPFRIYVFRLVARHGDVGC